MLRMYGGYEYVCILKIAKALILLIVSPAFQIKENLTRICAKKNNKSIA